MNQNKELQERRLLKLLYAGTIMLLVILSWITYSNMLRFIETTGEARQHNQFLLAIERSLTTLNEQETGARGFILAEDSLFLEPYHRALEVRDQVEEQLASAISAPHFQPLLDTLLAQRSRTTDMHRLMVMNVGNRRDKGMKERLLLGKSTMDHARELHQYLADAVREDRIASMLSLENDRVFSPQLMAAYSLLAILAISILFWRLSRSLRHTEHAKEDLRDKLEKLDREIRARRETQALLEQVLDTSPAGIMTFAAVRGADGAILDLTWTSSNRAANTMVGRQDLVGRRLLEEMPGNRTSGLFDMYVGVVESGTEARREFHYQDDGMDRWYANHAVKLGDGFLVVFADITEQKRAEQSRFEHGRFELIGQITRTVAHEVRNPLTNIQLALEELQDELGPDAARHSDLLEVVDRNLVRIGTLVKDMLESTRKREVNMGPCDLVGVMERAMHKVKDRLDLLEMRASCHADHPSMVVNGDGELLVLAITNLLVNAIEAMEPGKGVLDMSVRSNGPQVMLLIEDNGRGMSAEVRDKLFEPFFSGRRGGLGLGLTTTRSILSAHGAEIEVTSEEGRGSCFILSFPLQPH